MLTMTRKWLALLLAALLALTACAWAEETDDPGEEAEMAEGADSDWYMAVLIDPEITGEYPYHCFVDVNENGVPALFVTTTGSAFLGEEDRGQLYLYKDGEAALALTFGGGSGEKFYCNADTHTLTHYTRMSGEAHIEVCEAKDGALTPVLKADRYEANHGPAENAEGETFFQDDQEISAEEGEALFALYASDAEEISYTPIETAAPQEDMTREALELASGVAFGVPEGAEDVAYSWYEADGIAEMRFTLDGDEYCARIKPAALEIGEVENISDMYFAWENEEEVTIGGHCQGTLGQAQTGSEEFVELCLWYDLVPGLMYSLSVYTPELDGLDLTAVAEMVYVPMQGED